MNNPNDISREAWEANAENWDAKMGADGNDFFNILCWPVIESLLAPKPAARILDIACGNGLTSRRLAAIGADVTAFDFSANLIQFAKSHPNPNGRINYHVLDATDEQQLLERLSTAQPFDSAISNMALFDMPEIQPVFRALRKLLRPDGAFIFSLMHPAFNNPSAALLAEEWDDGQIHTRYAVKVSRYMTQYQSEGLALRSQPKPQLYFHRPVQDYIQAALENGFTIDGFIERAFLPEHPQNSILGWGGKFSEIPPALIIRARHI